MLQGKKTYILAGLAALATFAKYAGLLTEDMYQTLIGLIGAGAVATLRSSVSDVNKKLGVTILFILGSTALMSAQAIPSSKLAWDQPAPDLASAQAYTYKYYPDGSLTGNTLIGVVCSGATSPFQCEVAYPSFTPGNHTLILSATNIAGESNPKSAPFAFAFVVTPGTPLNIHIK